MEQEVVNQEELQEDPETLQSVGQAFNVILTNHHSHAVKNISVSENLHIGVKSQGHARGKITGHPNPIESLTSLNLID